MKDELNNKQNTTASIINDNDDNEKFTGFGFALCNKNSKLLQIKDS